ncbi:hypothetical protein VNO77_22975 [Canavalia gladiata]|uniref:Uncharacterized protein n=1 Tax=Canavalia gladiata TaxID=3824 RepID=A0AAN9QBG4_CANGL
MGTAPLKLSHGGLGHCRMLEGIDRLEKLEPGPSSCISGLWFWSHVKHNKRNLVPCFQNPLEGDAHNLTSANQNSTRRQMGAVYSAREFSPLHMHGSL